MLEYLVILFDSIVKLFHLSLSLPATLKSHGRVVGGEKLVKKYIILLAVLCPVLLNLLSYLNFEVLIIKVLLLFETQIFFDILSISSRYNP